MIINNDDVPLSSDTEPKVKSPTLESLRKAQSLLTQRSPTPKTKISNRSHSSNRSHFRNWTVASVIPSPDKIGINNQKMVEALRLSITEHHEKHSNRSNQSDYSVINPMHITPPQTTPRRQYGNYQSDEDINMPDIDMTDGDDADVDVDIDAAMIVTKQKQK